VRPRHHRLARPHRRRRPARRDPRQERPVRYVVSIQESAGNPPYRGKGAPPKKSEVESALGKVERRLQGERAADRRPRPRLRARQRARTSTSAPRSSGLVVGQGLGPPRAAPRRPDARRRLPAPHDRRRAPQPPPRTASGAATPTTRSGRGRRTTTTRTRTTRRRTHSTARRREGRKRESGAEPCETSHHRRRELRVQFNSPVAYVVLGGSMLLARRLFFVIPHMSVGRRWSAASGIDRATSTACSTALPPLLSIFVIPARHDARARRGEALGHPRASHHDAGEGQRGHPRQVPRGVAMVPHPARADAALPDRHVRVAVAPRGARLGAVWAGYLGSSSSRARGGRRRDDLLEHHREHDHRVLFDAFTLVLLYVIGDRSRSTWHGASATPVVPQLPVALSKAFARGLIDTRAVVYFLSVAILCLLVAFRSLESRKWS
jgi:hypothetical protein